MDQALRGDFAESDFVAGASVVLNFDPLSLEKSDPNLGEEMTPLDTPTHLDQLDAFADLFGGGFTLANNGIKPRKKRLYVRTDDAALIKVLKQLLHGDESEDFLLGEPKAWE